MARHDLSNEEIRDLRSWLSIGSPPVVPPRYRGMIERLLGELHELRDREALARHLQGLEGEY